MEAVREIVLAQGQSITVKIPPAFEGREVEVIVLPVVPSSAVASSDVMRLYGCLSAHADPDLIPHEKAAWRKATEAKHGTG